MFTRTSVLRRCKRQRTRYRTWRTSKSVTTAMTFRQFVATVRQKGFLVVHDVSPQRVNDWFADDHKRKAILAARRAFLATQPKHAHAFLESHTHEESSPDENELLFTSKIVPNFEARHRECEARAVALPNRSDARCFQPSGVGGADCKIC